MIEQVIDCKEKQLQAVQTAVKSTVENSAKEQFKSYSEAVMVCQLPDSDSMSPETLKLVIRWVAHEEDRRKSVIFFGVQEKEQDNSRECVKEVSDEMSIWPDICETAGLILGQARV